MAFLQNFCRSINNRIVYSVSKSLYSTQFHKVTNYCAPLIITSTNITNPWIWQNYTKIECPLPSIKNIDLPRSTYGILPSPQLDPNSYSKIEIVDPLLEINKYEKQMVRLIVIRRRKMRRHKLRKLRKKMKFEWAKRRQRREMRKEKDFQAELLAQIKKAEEFSAENYVTEKIRKATEVPIPRLWKGKRLPEFIIREKLGLPPK